jgi:hypothetical protein
MADSCEHLGGLRPEDFPPQRTPNACEECLARALCGSRCASATRAAMLAVAIPRRAGTRPSTFTRRNIRSCVRSRRRLGHGAMFMRDRVCSVKPSRRRTAGDAAAPERLKRSHATRL